MSNHKEIDDAPFAEFDVLYRTFEGEYGSKAISAKTLFGRPIDAKLILETVLGTPVEKILDVRKF